MFKLIVGRHIIYVLMGIFAVMGVVSKLIVSVTLRKLMKAAGNMGKSNHALMRLVRAKFEHVCMISEKVENVEVFVDKYLYEFRVAGFRIHTLQRMELAGAGMCLLLGLIGGGLSYYTTGLQNEAIELMGTGTMAALLIVIAHFLTDEVYRMDIVRNYMIDYLENICMRKYGKIRNSAAAKVRIRKEEISDLDAWDAEIPEEMKADREFRIESQEEEIKAGNIRISEGEEARNNIIRTIESEDEKNNMIRMAETEEPESNKIQTIETSIKTTDKQSDLDKQSDPGRHSEQEEVVKTAMKSSKNEFHKKREKHDVFREEPQKEENREVRIRQILEEFMA